MPIPHPSLAKADAFLSAFTKKFNKKYGDGIDSFNAQRAPFWRLLVQAMEKAAECKSCPYLRLIVACEIAVKANQPMLPPRGHHEMLENVNKKGGTGGSGIQFCIGGSCFRSGGDYVGNDVNDARIPKIVEEAILALPGGYNIPESIRDKLSDCATELALESDKITGWVKGKGAELGYWEKDFVDLSKILRTRLGLTAEELQQLDAEVAEQQKEKKEERDADFSQGVMNFLDMMNGNPKTGVGLN